MTESVGNQPFLASSREAAARGLWPHAVTLPRGTVLYRFIDRSRGTAVRAADGPWWFEYEHYQAIRHFALRHGYPVGYAARLFAAILYEWSEVDAVVRAALRVPLVAWKGRGKPVAATERDPRDVNRVIHGRLTEAEASASSRFTPLSGANEVYQIYVPGLGAPWFAFERFFELLTVEPIASR
jgi:hypothetical protein